MSLSGFSISTDCLKSNKIKALGASASRTKNEQCDIAMSLIGPQAPLEPPAVDNGPEELHLEPVRQ